MKTWTKEEIQYYWNNNLVYKQTDEFFADTKKLNEDLNQNIVYRDCNNCKFRIFCSAQGF